MRPRVLMATAHDWGSPLRLGCHHLAAGLVEAGCDVAYVSMAVSPVQFLRDSRELRERLGRRRRGGETDLDGHLWAYTPVSLITPHNAPAIGGRTIHREWHRLTVPNVSRVVKGHGYGEVDLLYIDSPVQLFWLDRVRHRASVARVGDRYAGFTGISPQVLELQRELVRSVDVVACSAGAIVDDLHREGITNTLHLPNGVDYHHFADGDRAKPEEYRAIPSPVAIYVGDMADWFDYELVNRLTQALPNVSFVFIGPDRLARARLTPRPNVHILGQRPFDELPAYLWNADVGLIPFDVAANAELVNAVHPLKLYEYLACGLPVVATRWQELERLDSPAALCVGFEETRRAIESAIAEPPDAAARQAFARRADWATRVRMLLDHVGIGAGASP